jgi:hypothetical protein
MFVKMASPTGWPDWVNFRPLGDCLVWVVFLKITEVAHIFGLDVSIIKVNKFWQKIGLATFWAFF